MIRRKVMICDVCSKEIDDDDSYYKFKKYQYRVLQTDRDVIIEHMCQDCFNAFGRFARKGGV